MHDLHVVDGRPGVIACSCHIVVAEQSVREGQQVLRAVVHEISHHSGSRTPPCRSKWKAATPTTCIAGARGDAHAAAHAEPVAR